MHPSGGYAVDNPFASHDTAGIGFLTKDDNVEAGARALKAGAAMQPHASVFFNLGSLYWNAAAPAQSCPRCLALAKWCFQRAEKLLERGAGMGTSQNVEGLHDADAERIGRLLTQTAGKLERRTRSMPELDAAVSRLLETGGRAAGITHGGERARADVTAELSCTEVQRAFCTAPFAPQAVPGPGKVTGTVETGVDWWLAASNRGIAVPLALL